MRGAPLQDLKSVLGRQRGARVVFFSPPPSFLEYLEP